MGHLKHNRRPGFTLIELLTVISIITLMMSLLVGASFRFVASARETATATTVTKASGIIQDRVRAFQEFNFAPAGVEYATSIGQPAQVAEILVRKARFKKAFPQAFAELDAAQTTRYFGTATVPPSAPYDSKYEPGIVLYALLLKGETFGAPTPGDDTFSGAEVRNGPETGNLPCLVDAWGEPLRFYRWPTRLIRCGENNLADYNNNGTINDPAGTISASGAVQASPAIRPTGTPTGATSGTVSGWTLKSPTPASLLIRNLPPFDISSSSATGPDQTPGILGQSSPANTLGWPTSDDPEFLNTDPDDPTFLLFVKWLSNSTNATAFVVGSELDSTGSYYVNAYHDPCTYSSPLIVSAGPDKKLGLWEPTDIPSSANRNSQNFGYLAAPQSFPQCVNDIFDDISNLNQRAGGK